VQTEDEQAAGVNGNWEARVEAALVDVGAVGATQVRHQQPPVFLLQPSVRARDCGNGEDDVSLVSDPTNGQRIGGYLERAGACNFVADVAPIAVACRVKNPSY